MRTVWLVLLAALLGTALGMLVGTTLGNGQGDGSAPADPPERATEPQEEEPGGAGSSYYLDRIRRHGLAVEEMRPVLISPRAEEHRSERCPPNLVIQTAQRGHADSIGPWLDALGDSNLSPATGSGVAREAAQQILGQWRRMTTIADGRVTDPPLRLLVKHYPRPDLDGDAVTLQMTLYDVPDMYFDEEWFAERARDVQRMMPLEGAILDLRRTWRLDGDAPRLVEVLVEAHLSVAVGPLRAAPGRYVPALRELPVSRDPSFSAHFDRMGGGTRFGLAWYDLSGGEGPAQPWSTAYRIDVTGADVSPAVALAPLPDAMLAELRRFLGRL